MKEFTLKDDAEFIALCDLLKTTDLCQNGGHAKHVIAAGEVTVNGVIETRKRCKIRSGETIVYNGQTIKVL